MSVVQEHYGWIALGLIVLTLALTVYVFRHRLFDRGYTKGSAANPIQTRAQNPPDGRGRRENESAPSRPRYR